MISWQEDSGSALVCKDRLGIWTQVGIVNFFFKSEAGEICSNSIFTSVDPYLDFIHEGIISIFKNLKKHNILAKPDMILGRLHDWFEKNLFVKKLEKYL